MGIMVKFSDFPRRRVVVAGMVVMWLAGTVAPCHAELAEDLRAAASEVSGHPRLFIQPGGQAALRERAKADPKAELITRALIAKADAVLGEPPVTRELQGRRMLAVSRNALDRLATWSIAWQLTGERRYVDRAAAELRAVAAFDDWNPSHFLDVAEMTLGVAIAYDWLHAELDPETRELARRAIFEKGLTPALASDRHWWIRTTNNWNQVCHGGLAAGALVLLEHEPEAALRILERAVRFVPNSMAAYAPLGAYPEGPGYWSYGTSYNVILLAILESALGGTFGLDEMEGFDQTGAFPILMTGPSGEMFNFSDGRSARGLQPAVYWLARRFSQPGWAAHEDRLIDRSAPAWNRAAGHWYSMLTLLWRDVPVGPAAAPDLPLHWTSRCENPISVHRESWDRPDAVFVGLKAGTPMASHGQMDIGSFVLDANGVRWAHDLGMESYFHIESRGMRLWDKHQDSERWRVFRNNNLSHNTLVIDGQLQRAASDAPVLRFSDDPAFPHSVVDMSETYAGQVESAHRGVALLPGGVVVVRDALTGLRPGADLRWAMVTKAEIGSTGGSTVTLSERGESLVMAIHGGEAAVWREIDIASPPNEWDSPNVDTSMVAFSAIAPESGALDFTVLIRPGDRPEIPLPERALAHPLKWSPGGR